MPQDRLFRGEDFVPDLPSYDVILVNSSAGKDSQCMLDYVVELAKARGVENRITVAHADLGEMAWPGTLQLAEEHARSYGLRFESVRREGPDLLARVQERGMWPDAARRWCTSSFKRQELLKLVTSLVEELNVTRLGIGWCRRPLKRSGLRPVRVLSCMGMRASESPARAKKAGFYREERASSGRRTIDAWLPLFSWSDDEVWERINGCPTRVHDAYSLGMSRASCSLCMLSSRRDLVLAARLRPELAERYLEVEEFTGHRFRKDLSMREIVRMASEGEEEKTTA